MRHGGANHADGAEEQQVGGILPGGIVERHRVAGGRAARVGHQCVDAAERLGRMRHPAVDRGLVADVDRRREHPGAGLILDPLCRCFDRLPAAR